MANTSESEKLIIANQKLGLQNKDKRSAELAIAQNETRFRFLIEKSNDMITLSSKGGEVVYGSPSIKKILGYTADEYINKYPHNIIHPEDLKEYLEKRKKVLQEPSGSFHFEHRRLHKKGSWIWCEGTVTNYLNEPKLNRLVSNFRDISEKKIRDNEREFDKNNLHALINNTKDLLWSVDKDFNLITSNERFDEITKLMSGKTITKGTNVLNASFNPEKRLRYKKFYERALAGDIFTEVEYTNSPIEIWSEISFYPILKGEEIIGTACYSHDITDRKRAETLLRKSEAFNLGVLNSLSAHIAVIDNLGNIVAINEAWQRFAKENGETTLKRTGVGSNYFKVCKESIEIGNEDASDALKGMMDVLQGKKNDFYLEYPCHSPDEQRWFAMSAKMFEGDEEMVVVAHLNVTERKLAQKKVSESERRFREIFESSPIPIIILDITTKTFSKFNDKALKLFKYPTDKFKKMGPEDISPEFQSDGNPSKEKAMEFNMIALNGSMPAFEWLFIDAEGADIICEVQLAVLTDNNDSQIIGSFVDITERKRSEKALQLTQFAFDNASDAIFWMSSDARIVNVNEAAYVSLGYTQQELLSLSVPDIDLSFNLEVWSAFFPELREKQSISIETTQQRKDGSSLPVEIRSNYIKFGDKEFSCAFVRDITERKKVEQNLEQQNKELKKANTELDRFVYSTSHDLRAPLASLLGLIDITTDDIEPGNELQIEYMGMMKQSVLKLDKFIGDILNYSRNARTELEKEDIVFEDIVQEACAEYKIIEDTNEFKLKVDVKQTADFSSDKRRINIILNNLISNVVKYKDAAKEKSFVYILVRSDKKNATIIIEDNGIGIAEKDKTKIFEMFYRASKQSTGSGLGLYIVKETIEKLGATIIMESEIMVGSKFTITVTNLLNDENKNNITD